MANWKRFTVLPIAAISLTALLGGCAAGADQNLGDGESDLTAAKATVEEFLANPSSVGYDTPVSAPIPTGKKIVALQVNADIMRMVTDSLEEAALELGWSYQRILVGSGAEDMASALDQAIATNPDAIYYSGQGTTEAILPQLEEAASKGILIVNEALGSERPEQVIAQIRDGATATASGKLLADWIAVDSDGSAKVLLVDVPSYPVLVPFGEAIKDELAAVCAECSVTTIDVSLADIGTNLPTAVVSALQRDPELKYVAFGFGDMTIGLEPALLAAGIEDQATITGQMPGAESIQTLRDGANGAWIAHISAESGWRAVDAFARAFVGDDPTIVEGVPAMQILTKGNVADANYTDDGYWVPSADLKEQFLSMWNVQ